MKLRFFAAIAAGVLCFALALENLETGRRSQGRQQLEDALHRAALACYAQEGFYPPSLDYIREHYALRYDPRVYIVHYTCIGSNLMPDITVLEASP